MENTILTQRAAGTHCGQPTVLVIEHGDAFLVLDPFEGSEQEVGILDDRLTCDCFHALVDPDGECPHTQAVRMYQQESKTVQLFELHDADRLLAQLGRLDHEISEITHAGQIQIQDIQWLD